jgi:hypothetical protein
MRPPDRLTVPTCIGCGAMCVFGTCERGCSENKLELVRATACDMLRAGAAEAKARADAFADLAQRLASNAPGHEVESAYRSAQRNARQLLRRHPKADQADIDPEQPAEHATTWWCAECGGLDAPQPCLRICVWRPVEWVRRSVYEELRARAMAEQQRVGNCATSSAASRG